MKLLAKPVIFILALFILMMIAAACKKDKDMAAIDIAGFELKDAAGNDFGRYGPVDNDWTFNNTLSDRELALFDFTSADVNLDNTVEAAISGNHIFAYPNPCANSQYYHVSTSDLVLMKVVVVNNKLDVLAKKALKVKYAMNFVMDYYSDSLLFPNKSSLRMYYSFSARNKPNYKVGYGDIKICRLAQPTNVNDCFR